ncbi:20e38744-c043-412c-b53e-b7646074f128 [Thermothielavioides terrestris]
MMSD